MGPYRAVNGTEIVEAPTRLGMARLRLLPKHVVLEVGSQRLSVTESYATVIDTDRQKKKRKPRPRSMRLDGARLIVARAVPTEDIGVWYEPRPGGVVRIFGVQPVELLDAEALAAWSALDRLAQRLKSALGRHTGDLVRASEIGHGADRVLITDDGECLVVHVRRLFRHTARRALEARSDGAVTIHHRRRIAELRCTSRHQVTILGDFVRFAKPDGEDIDALSVPWISTEERRMLAAMIGRRIDQAP